MYKQKSIVAVILARGGSKGIPKKNIKLVGNKPLIGWTVEAACRSAFLDSVYVSTDNTEIADTAKTFGSIGIILRPAQFAIDTSPNSDALLHALEYLEQTFDYLVFLQPTTPLRNTSDIDHCIQTIIDSDARACVSVTEQKKPLAWHYRINDSKLVSIFQDNNFPHTRQQAETIYVLNGGVYIAEVSFYQQHKTFLTEQTLAYVMPEERSLDIDTTLDLAIANALLLQDSNIKEGEAS